MKPPMRGQYMRTTYTRAPGRRKPLPADPGAGATRPPRRDPPTSARPAHTGATRPHRRDPPTPARPAHTGATRPHRRDPPTPGRHADRAKSAPPVWICHGSTAQHARRDRSGGVLGIWRSLHATTAPPTSGVQRHLLGGGGERPGHLQPALLAEDEAQLAGRTQSLRMGGAEGPARPVSRDGAEKVLPKEAPLAARLCPLCLSPTLCHLSVELREKLKPSGEEVGHQIGFHPLPQRRSSENADNSRQRENCQIAGRTARQTGSCRIFRRF